MKITPKLYDSHMHTPLCKHADGMPEEYAARALMAGMKGIIFTCHSPMPDGWFGAVRMAPEELSDYVHMVDRARNTYAQQIDIRLGLESDYFPGMEDWLTDLHKKADFHYILGSVHYFGPEYMEAYYSRDYSTFISTYFKHLGDAAESGLFDSIAHADLIKNHDPQKWDYEAFRPQMEEALDRIAAAGTAMEINTSGMHKRIPEMNPSLPMLKEMQKRGIPVVLGSDAHSPNRVGERFETALNLMDMAGYSAVSYFQYRERIDIPFADLMA